MPKKITAVKPKIFKEPKRVGRRAIASMTNEVLNELQATAMRVDDVYVKRMPKYLEITEKQLEKKGVVDLKKAFASSPKRKIGKDGTWHLTIPIRIKTSNMSKKTYHDLRTLDLGNKSSKTIQTNYIQELAKKEISHPALVPQPPHRNTTKTRSRKSKRASYFIFRTVSAKSPANSWMLNRDRVNQDNFSKTTMLNVQRLMDWKMKNILH